MHCRRECISFSERLIYELFCIGHRSAVDTAKDHKLVLADDALHTKAPSCYWRLASLITGVHMDLYNTKAFAGWADDWFWVLAWLCPSSELMFLETSALTGENVEEGFLKCARTILNKIESGKWKLHCQAILVLVYYLLIHQAFMAHKVWRAHIWGGKIQLIFIKSTRWSHFILRSISR